MVQPYKESGVVMVSEHLTLSISRCLSRSLTIERDHETEKVGSTLDFCITSLSGVRSGTGKIQL